ncbi:hypothetical protein BDN71DRAFT_1235396 [Pleurotus eryngii]|uniref:Uncharacterized protein n=1 Tax=Pleurotus eryngii TaxID=5323 RepID=A0A9P5ZS04_PLEER|nr:hypothetical protein BDN71DRAFT_1235396 [Pleurotus eryngii]
MMIDYSLCLRGRACWLALSIIALAVSVVTVYHTKSIMGIPILEQRTYSYIGDDYPEFWGIDLGNPVAMTTEESEHYPVHGLDAEEEWASTASAGFGYVRLGEEYRAFAVNVFHQLHCLRAIRDALAHPGNRSPAIDGHFQHCLNFIRQFALCSPNLTLEPADALNRDFATQRSGAVQVCKDWRKLYDHMSDNWASWKEFQNRTQYS